MNLKHLSDETLISETKRLVKEEREHLTVVLHHLAEIYRRRLFSNYGCDSIHHYAMIECGYSKSEAQRRCSAVFAIIGVPEVEGKIESGDLNLTHINIAQRMFTIEKKQGRAFTPEKKAEVFEAISGHTTREAQKILFDFAPEMPQGSDEVKPVGKNRNRLGTDFSDDTIAKVERLLALLAHQNLNVDQLVNKLCDLGLEEFDPAKAPKAPRKKESQAEVRRKVWRRDDGKCTKCGSRFALQYDHVNPKSLGGEDTFENLRLLCRSCNQRAAIEKLGQRKMEAHLNRHARPRQSSAPNFRHSEPLDRDREGNSWVEQDRKRS